MANVGFTIGIIVAALLLVAAVVDWRTRTIPNWVNAAIAILAIPYWWVTELSSWPGLAIQLGVALAAFAFFTGIWKLGQMGGGDVKLIVALALFLPPLDFVRMLFVMALAGGVLTIVLALEHRVRRRPDPFENPYGIAIAIAGITAISERYLNHLA